MYDHVEIELNDKESIRQQAKKIMDKPVPISDVTITVSKDKITQLLRDSDMEYIEHGNKMLIGILTLPNGFKINAQSSCVDVSSFDVELAESIVMRRITEKLYDYEAYLLTHELYLEKVRSYQGSQ